MKNTLLFLLLSSGVSMAATITVGNVNDLTNSNGITSLTGSAIASGSGSAQVGYFNGVADVAAADIATLTSTFVPYGNLINFGAGLGLDGVFQGSVNGAVVDGTEFAGKALYLMITNSSTGFTAAGTTTASQAMVWSSNTSFPTEEPFNASINVQNGQGTLIKGGYNNFTLSYDQGVTQVPTYNLIAIPEPSGALLGALGALGLLRRRRN